MGLHIHRCAGCRSAISGYAAQREFGRQAIRSRQVLRDLGAAQRALVAAGSVQAVRSIATQIDSLVHGDAADWFINANLHEPELPEGVHPATSGHPFTLAD